MQHVQTFWTEFRGACEVVFRHLHQSGVGADVKHTAIISNEEEDKLWSSGALNITDPKGLQQVVFYYVRKVYCIRGEEEQRCLKPSQFVRSCQPDCYTYTEHGSKNRSGGLAELHVENKQVPCYANPGNAPRCTLLRKTFFIFNLKRCSLLTTHSDCWYDCVPVGKNKLSTMVRDICTAGGITKKTNHSLRATGATALFKAGVPEKIIQSTTGHRSVDALQCYERVSDEQQQATSRVLTACDPNVRVNAEMSRVKVQQATCTCKYACKYAESSQSLPLASVFG